MVPTTIAPRETTLRHPLLGHPLARVALSSLGHPFLLISANVGNFVQAVEEEAVEAEKCKRCAGPDVACTDASVTAYHAALVAAYCTTPTLTRVVVDFEGEMLGFGGEMTMATFVPYMDTGRDVAVSVAGSVPGLCIDMTSESGIALCRTLMECPTLCKLVWGASSDCAALLHQHYPRSLGVTPRALLDVQLRFSESPKRRTGLAKAIAHVQTQHPDAFAGLPDKATAIDWNRAYATNQKAIPFPLSHTHLRYALDDVHRVARVLTSLGGCGADDLTMCAPVVRRQFRAYDGQPYTLRVEGDESGEAAVHDGATFDPTIFATLPSDSLAPCPGSWFARPHAWSVVAQMSAQEQLALEGDPFGIHWFFREYKMFNIARRNRHSAAQQQRRAVVLQRHLYNVFRRVRVNEPRMNAEGDNRSGGALIPSAPLAPSTVRRMLQTHVELKVFLKKKRVHVQGPNAPTWMTRMTGKR